MKRKKGGREQPIFFVGDRRRKRPHFPMLGFAPEISKKREARHGQEIGDVDNGGWVNKNLFFSNVLW
jgi:hypothetical protein